MRSQPTPPGTRRAGPGKAAGNGALLARPVAVGPVRLRPWKPGKVQLDFRLPDGTNPRPVFAVADLAAAYRLAGDLATAVESLRRGIAMEHPLAMVARLQGRPAPADNGAGSGAPESDAGPTIGEALEGAISEGSRGNARTKDQYRFDANAFLAWLRAERPSMPDRWSAVTPKLLATYAAGLPPGLSNARLKQRLNPLALASRHWHAREPDRFDDVSKAMRPPEGRDKRPTAALAPAGLAAYLAALRRLAPALHPLAAMSALAGLRMLEAASLRRHDVELVSEPPTVEVREACGHKPKNRGSWRTVPLAPSAAAVLREAAAAIPTAADADGPLLADAGGRPWNLERIKAAWKAFRRDLDRENATLPEDRRTMLPDGFSARAGRACFATLASKGGADRALLKRYMGHSAGDILGHHYLALDVEDLGAVAMAFEAASRNVPATICD